MSTEYSLDALKYIRATGGNFFSDLADVTRIAEKFATDQPTYPSIRWSEDDNYKSIFYNNGRISIDGIAILTTMLEDEAWDLLQEKVLLLGDPIDPDETSYTDMMSSLRPCYSFYKDPANDKLTDSKTTGYIFSSPSLRLKFFGDGNESRKFGSLQHLFKIVR